MDNLKTYAQRVFDGHGLLLRWLLLLWLAALLLLLALDADTVVANRVYHPLVGAGMLALLGYGVLNIYFGIVAEFSVMAMAKTAAALFVGAVGVSALLEQGVAPWQWLVAVLLYGGGLAALLAWRRRQERAMDSEQARPLDDASIRGGAAVFRTGSDSYHLVPRRNSDCDAARFERRLIRYLERTLGVNIVALAGGNSHYWGFKTRGGIPIELAVIGPGYNTAARLREGERWLLRIREPQPGFLAHWLARHFPPGSGISRDLGREVQTQFASRHVVSDGVFFEQEVAAPGIGLLVSVEEAMALLDTVEDGNLPSGTVH